jgi:TonB family protein
MIADILHGLAKANIAAGLAVAAILTIRPLARRWLGAQTAYGLWLVAPLAATGALLPARKVVLLQTVAANNALPHAISPTFVATDYSPLLFGLWVTGVALSLVVLAERQRRFKASLGRLTPATGRTLLAEYNGGPAVLGALIPWIVLPADFEARFSPSEREAILAHERTHLVAGHAQTNGLVAVIQSLCWFNPLAYVATRALRLDQELACDAAVLSQSAASPRLYGEALLRTQLNAPPLPLGCYWPSTGPKSLKERFLMLKKPTPSRTVRWTGAGLVSLAAMVAALGAWAAKPARVEIDSAPYAEAQPALPARAAQEAEAAQEAGAAQEARPAQAPPQVSTGNSVTPAAARSSVPDHRITEPNWIETPTSADYVGLYPQRAAQQEKTGKVTMQCLVTETGSVNNCAVTQETPEGLGFGDAALAMADKFKMSPATRDGAPVGGAVVTIPIMFALQ